MFLLQLVLNVGWFSTLRGEKPSCLVRNFWMCPIAPIPSLQIPPVCFFHIHRRLPPPPPHCQLRCHLLCWTCHLAFYFSCLCFALWGDTELINFSRNDGKHFTFFFIMVSSWEIIPPPAPDTCVVCI